MRRNGQEYIYKRKERQAAHKEQDFGERSYFGYDYDDDENADFNLERRIQSQVYESASEAQVQPSQKPAVLSIKKEKTANF